MDRLVRHRHGPLELAMRQLVQQVEYGRLSGLDAQRVLDNGALGSRLLPSASRFKANELAGESVVQIGLLGGPECRIDGAPK